MSKLSDEKLENFKKKLKNYVNLKLIPWIFYDYKETIEKYN